ncbi:MAG: hypothetical protein V3V10_01275 [Planctomycetota bacterium]
MRVTVDWAVTTYTSAMLRLCLLLLALTAPCLTALEFDVSRAAVAQSATETTEEESPEPGFAFKEPWGLWAWRAPYPYYDGPFGIDVADDLVARDIWFDFETEMWFGANGYRGGSFQLRSRFGIFFVDSGYTQIAQMGKPHMFDSGKVEDYAYITDFRGHMGVTLPLGKWGYADAGVGGIMLDQSNKFSTRLGFSFRSSLSVYPIWPLELEGYASRAQFTNGQGVNDFGVRIHVQAFRHLFVTTGWRWYNVDGNGFSTHGWTIGLSFQWANLRTFFWEPMRGPAY